MAYRCVEFGGGVWKTLPTPKKREQKEEKKQGTFQQRGPSKIGETAELKGI